MKLQNKSFHKSWINNVQKRENDISSNLNNNKYILKIIFLSLIILSVIIVLKWWQKVPNKEILNLGHGQNTNQTDTLLKPIILFKNKNNSVFTLKSIEAKRNASNSAIIILKKPEGYYKLSNKKDIYFYATKGILDNNKQILELIKNVIIESPKGTKFYTKNLTYIVNNNIIKSDDAVTVNGNWGSINGKGFIYNLDDSNIRLKGRPVLSLSNNKGNIK